MKKTTQLFLAMLIIALSACQPAQAPVVAPVATATQAPALTPTTSRPAPTASPTAAAQAPAPTATQVTTAPATSTQIAQNRSGKSRATNR